MTQASSVRHSSAEQSELLMNTAQNGGTGGWHDPLFEEKPQPEQDGGRLAIAAVILGGVAVLFSCLRKISAVLAVAAILTGIAALVRHSGAKKLAIAGIVLGSIALLIAGIVTLMVWLGLLGQETVPGMLPDINPDQI